VLVGHSQRCVEQLFRHSFPDLAGRHDAGSVESLLCIRLLEAIDAHPLGRDLGYLLNLAAASVRWILLDLARRFRRQQRRQLPLEGVRGSGPDPLEPAAGSSADPARAAGAGELREQLDRRLDEQERAIVEQRFYLGLTWEQIGAVVGLPEHQVRRKARQALDKLSDVLS
jgi:RNA polymerase sigma factor (sigma-70 family)